MKPRPRPLYRYTFPCGHVVETDLLFEAPRVPWEQLTLLFVGWEQGG